MKKIGIALIALMFIITTNGMAQNSKKGTARKKAKTEKSIESSTQTEVTTTREQHLKKDGTPDKRYKENKKLKKDGTPDRRYKENK